MKILFCGYRDWAMEVFEKIKYKYHFANFTFDLVKNDEEFNKLNHSDYELILFIGWSWIIKPEIVKNNICICAHPSPLPKYRGGSPLQHQIINGEKDSALTLFIMNDKIDAGPIVTQVPFSLEGELQDVVRRMKESTIYAIRLLIYTYLLDNRVPADPQDESQKTYFKRRTPEQSEITIEEIQNSTPEQLYNKIRALQDPYPNAFIRCKNGEKLYLTRSRYDICQ